jgi:hypothetical protein
MPFTDIGSIFTRMKNAETRDAVLELILVAARTVARKAALFVLKKDVFAGWTCTPEFGRTAELRELSIPFTDSSVLALSLPGPTYLGPMSATHAHAPIFGALRCDGRRITTTAVRVAGRAAVVLLCDDIDDPAVATRRLDEIAAVAGEALQRILASGRK